MQSFINSIHTQNRYACIHIFRRKELLKLITSKDELILTAKMRELLSIGKPQADFTPSRSHPVESQLNTFRKKSERVEVKSEAYQSPCNWCLS